MHPFHFQILARKILINRKGVQLCSLFAPFLLTVYMLYTRYAQIRSRSRTLDGFEITPSRAGEFTLTKTVLIKTSQPTKVRSKYNHFIQYLITFFLSRVTLTPKLPIIIYHLDVDLDLNCALD